MEKPGIEPATPGLQGIALIHYTMDYLHVQADNPWYLYDANFKIIWAFLLLVFIVIKSLLDRI